MLNSHFSENPSINKSQYEVPTHFITIFPVSDQKYIPDTLDRTTKHSVWSMNSIITKNVKFPDV